MRKAASKQANLALRKLADLFYAVHKAEQFDAPQAEQDAARAALSEYIEDSGLSLDTMEYPEYTILAVKEKYEKQPDRTTKVVGIDRSVLPLPKVRK